VEADRDGDRPAAVLLDIDVDLGAHVARRHCEHEQHHNGSEQRARTRRTSWLQVVLTMGRLHGRWWETLLGIKPGTVNVPDALNSHAAAYHWSRNEAVGHRLGPRVDLRGLCRRQSRGHAVLHSVR